MPLSLPSPAVDERQDAPPTRAAWLGLGVLTLINLFNYLDRFIVPAIGPSLTGGELRLTDTEFGFLATAFILVLMVVSPVFGVLGDRASRPRVIAAGVALWSLATAAGGLATGFWSLLATRAAVGVGEAAYGTIAPALLADYFPPRYRGRAFAVFYAATPVGAALGYVLGGLVDARFGWRHVFFVAGLPGLALAFLVLWLREPRSADRAARSDADTRRASIGESLRSYALLARNARYRLIVLGNAAYTFVVGGMGVWLIIYVQRVLGIPQAQATFQAGLVLVGTGFLGTIAGGWIADRLFRRHRGAYLLLAGVTTLAAAPCAYVVFSTGNTTVFWTFLIAAELLIFASNSPINAAIVNSVSPARWASAMALNVFVIHFLGDVPSPVIVGHISDLTSVQDAVKIFPAATAVAGVIWLWAGMRAEPRMQDSGGRIQGKPPGSRSRT
jgi:MFS family permease